jgi:hypothetical protein
MEVLTMQCARDPLYEIDPESGVSIEVSYADRALETFGRDGAGWVWWPCRRGYSPNGPPTGPFATSYSVISAGDEAMNGGAARRAIDQPSINHVFERASGIRKLPFPAGE